MYACLRAGEVVERNKNGILPSPAISCESLLWVKENPVIQTTLKQNHSVRFYSEIKFSYRFFLVLFMENIWIYIFL